ncbi:shikimate kinase [Oxynema aestuarii]
MTDSLLQNVNLYLVGMMGSGKTTVGRLLARELGYQFFDTDELVEEVAGCSIAQIFADAGEAQFRQLESQVLEQLCAYQKLLVATGGGIVLSPKNWSYLHHGLVVWLDVSAEQLYRRLQGDSSRPLLQNPDPLATLRSLLASRQGLYAQADLRLVVGEGETPEAIVRRAIAEIPKCLKTTTVDLN